MRVVVAHLEDMVPQVELSQASLQATQPALRRAARLRLLVEEALARRRDIKRVVSQKVSLEDLADIQTAEHAYSSTETIHLVIVLELRKPQAVVTHHMLVLELPYKELPPRKDG
jgi:hypothetical protein